MSRNANADNEMWDAYERIGKNFKGNIEDLEEAVVEEDVHPREAKKRRHLDLRFRDIN